MKVVIQLKEIYGNYNAIKLVKQKAVENTAEAKLNFLDGEGIREIDVSSGSDSDWDEFVNGEGNILETDYVGDWDEPSGYFVVVLTKEEHLESIENEYREAKEAHFTLFEEEF